MEHINCLKNQRPAPEDSIALKQADDGKQIGKACLENFKNTWELNNFVI